MGLAGDISSRTFRLFALLGVMSLWACGPKYPSCDNDDHCKDKEFCVNKQCQQCRTNGDCGQGNECNAGRCDPIDGYCVSDGSCGPGQGCENNRCTTVTDDSGNNDNTEPVASHSCDLIVIQFGYDSDTLESSVRNKLQQNARCIKERNISRLHLTGNTDPRGTEEYNLALGDRRARAVQKYLVSLGVTATITTSSMGEELAIGTDETSFGNDRKVVFIER